MINVNNIEKVISSDGGTVNITIKAHANPSGVSKAVAIQWKIIPITNTGWLTINGNILTSGELSDSGDKTVSLSASANSTGSYRTAEFKFIAKLYSGAVEEANITVQQAAQTSPTKTFDHYTVKNVSWSPSSKTIESGSSLTITATYDVYSVYTDDTDSLTASGRIKSVTIDNITSSNSYPTTDLIDSDYGNVVIGKEGCAVTVTSPAATIIGIDITDVSTTASPTSVDSGGSSTFNISYKWRYKYSDNTYGDKTSASTSGVVSNITEAKTYSKSVSVTHEGYTATVTGSAYVNLNKYTTTDVVGFGPNTYEAPVGGGSTEIRVNSFKVTTNTTTGTSISTQYSWTITGVSGRISVSKLSGTESETITLTVGENTTTTALDTTITVTCAELNVSGTLKITQPGKVVHDYKIVFDPESYTTGSSDSNTYVKASLYDGSTFVKVLSESDTTVTEDNPTWLTKEWTTHQGVRKCKLIWTENPSYSDNRVGTVTFVHTVDGTTLRKLFTVTQYPKTNSYSIELSTTTATRTATQTQQPNAIIVSKIKVNGVEQTDFDTVTATSNNTWLTVEVANGSGGHTWLIRSTANSKYTPRVGTVTFKYHDATANVIVTQAGSASITLSKTSITVPKDGSVYYTGTGHRDGYNYIYLKDLISTNTPSTAKIEYACDNDDYIGVLSNSDPWMYIGSNSTGSQRVYNVTFTQKIDGVTGDNEVLTITQSAS